MLTKPQLYAQHHARDKRTWTNNARHTCYPQRAHKLVGKKLELLEDKTIKNIQCDMVKMMMTAMMMVMIMVIGQDLKVNSFISSVPSLASF